MTEDIRYEKDKDGIVTLTLDMQGQSANTMNARFVPAMDAVMARLRAEDNLKGVIFTSAKKSFFAGGDLAWLRSVEKADEETFRHIEENKRPYRELEDVPVPVVAAINGAALGGGYELCLACNRRVILDHPKAIVGLPEVTLGLLPGAGGVVRLTALLGLEKALPALLEGKTFSPKQALSLGLVDEIAADEEALLKAAKDWIMASADSCEQLWHRKGFKYPGGGAESPGLRPLIQMAPAILTQRSRGLYPAPARILDIAVSSMKMNFDAALRVESRGLASLLITPEAKAAIDTFFYGMQEIKSGISRPKGARWKPASTAVVGAGRAGTGIAWVNATAGLNVGLMDTSLDKAEKNMLRFVKSGRRRKMDDGGRDKILSRIMPVANGTEFDGADLIIEAVNDDPALKKKVLPKIFKHLGPDGILASATSVLSVSLLAKSCPEPARFIGLHFMIPADRMKVVEIIPGEKTSEDTLRKAYDYVATIGYLPIVAKDTKGFFTSRVFSSYLDEGAALIVDGMAPALIERAAWRAGMALGPLTVHDDVSLKISKRFHENLALGKKSGWNDDCVIDADHTRLVSFPMVDAGRGGRRHGGGFFDYPEGGEKTPWPGLADFATGTRDISFSEAEDRLIYRQVIEALRCLHEGAIRTEAEANLGGIHAFGFPAHTGGMIRFIRGKGVDAFARRAAELADICGDRFAVAPEMLERFRAG